MRKRRRHCKRRRVRFYDRFLWQGALHRKPWADDHDDASRGRENGLRRAIGLPFLSVQVIEREVGARTFRRSEGDNAGLPWVDFADLVVQPAT